MESRRIVLTETPRVPPDGAIMGFGAMIPFPAALLAAWVWPEVGWLAARAAVVWGAAILLFLAGVRRGLSFRTEGGPRPSQVAMTLWLFALGLLLPLVPHPLALAGLIAGFGSLLILDPRAARRGEAPLYFARLRPSQMAIPVASAALLYFA
jgi:hypothetical protein